MYKKIDNGTLEIIGSTETGGVFECYIPPFGYGYNSITGELVKVDVIKRSNISKEQYWQREGLPDDYQQRRKLEEFKQDADEDYFDPELESIRQVHWHRRLNGCWVYMNGKPVYITGLHWFYLNWWQIDIGYPEYRNPDRKFFYVLLYCMLDPLCGGLLEATKRRQGKTYRGGCLLYEVISRTKNTEGGIQSKTMVDARDVVFKKAVISPFKKLPHFFIPVFDTSKGATPTSELKFAHTTKKGRKALEDLEKPELNSLIDWASSEVFSYDGRKKKIIFEDEIGKTIGINVYDRHQVVKYCIETDGRWTGFALKSTTVEEMESGGAEYKMLWDESNKEERDDNGHTKTGMYRYMTPAYETLYFDKYGMPDEVKAKEYFLNRRKGLANNPRALSSEIRKNPFNQVEMFRIDGDVCLYDSEKLNNQLDKISWSDSYTERGEFVWKEGERDTEVVWEKKKNGKFEISTLIPEELRGKVIKRGLEWLPNNKINFVAGCDPFQYDKTKDKRRSMGTGFVYWKYNSLYADNVYNDSIIVRYSNRPELANIFYEDMLKMCVFFGCQLLFERNKGNIKEYFTSRGYGNFLMYLPGEVEPGIYAGSQTHQEMCEATEEFINTKIEKVFFKNLIQQWLEFDVGDTEKYDEAMGAGWTLVAAKSKFKVKDRTEELPKITEFFKRTSVPNLN